MYGRKKDLLGLKDLSTEDIMQILRNAETMKFVLSKAIKKAPHLTGKSIVEMFVGESIRTKLSFELAAKYMSGTLSTLSVPVDSSREGILDIATAVDRMGADIIIMRHPMSGAVHLVAKNVKASVINAGDGLNEQPTQALVDIFTIYQKKGRIKGLKVALVGDVLHNGVARSNIWGLLKLGAEVVVGGPTTLIPKGLEAAGVRVLNSAQEAILDADVIMSIRLRSEAAEFSRVPDTREYARYFGINEKYLPYAKEDAIIMHALPAKRGVEIMSNVISCGKSVIGEQVTNGVAVKMSVLYMFAKGGVYENPDSEFTGNGPAKFI